MPQFQRITVVILTLIGVLLMLRWAMYNNQSRQLEERLAELEVHEATQRRLLRENRDLQEQIDALGTSDWALERLVRERTNWIRSDEIVIEFPPGPTDEP